MSNQPHDSATIFSQLDQDLSLSPAKSRVLWGALELFSIQGASGVSIRDITRHIGVSESSLYNHFRYKDEILDMLFGILRTGYRKLIPLTDNLPRIIPEMGPREFLNHGTTLYMDFIKNPVMGRIWRLVNIEQYRDPRARELILGDIMQGTLNFLEQAFEVIIDLGFVRNEHLSPTVLASEYQYAVFAMATELNMLQAQNMDTTYIEQRLRTHVEFFLDAIADK